MVIRKGHVAQRFYFIFSGSVCVTVDDDEHSAFAQPSENAVLSRGDYFGVSYSSLRRSTALGDKTIGCVTSVIEELKLHQGHTPSYPISPDSL